MYTSFISEMLLKAATIASGHFGHVIGSTKTEDNNQVLTQADIEVGNYLVDAVKKNYPQHNIIDEEAGVIDNASEYTWVIDPIDGTSNFANGLPHYGIMIGLLKGATPIAGGIVLPAFSELYLAEKNSGATCNGNPIQVSRETRLLSSLIAYGIDGHQEDPQRTERECALLSKIVLHIRNLRSSNSAFDTCRVATGAYGAFLNQTSKIWDNVAQYILITEAGGICTDFFGNPQDFSRPLEKVASNFTHCAAAPTLHAHLQQIIHD